MGDYTELYHLRNQPSMRRFFEDPPCRWRDDPRYWASAARAEDLPLPRDGGPRDEYAAQLKADYATRSATVESLRLNEYLFEVYRTGFWGVRARGAHPLIGVAGLIVCREHLYQDLVIGLTPERWGQGLATEAGRELIHFAFMALDFWEIRASFAPAHAAAIRLAEKLGLQPDDNLQDYFSQKWLFYQLSRERWAASTP